jgi:type I restriction enzyme S subunit
MKPGTIPDGWTSAPLGELCGRITTGKLDANAMVADGEYPFFTCARESYRINRYAFDTEALLVSGNGANVGYVHYYKGKFNAYQRTYVLSEFTADVHFLKMFLDRNLQDRIRVEVNAGNTPYITMGTLTEMGVVLPNDAPEQRAIAEALSDVDGLLGGLDRLIAKKRDLKQAAMQQLLTGQTRLPGFHGEWEVKRLGDVGEISSAGVDKKIYPDEVPVRLVNYLDVYHKDFIYSKDLNHWVTAPPPQAKRCAVQKGDVFFTPTSETRDDIGLSAVAMEDIPDAAYSYHVARLRLREPWDLYFRTYAFKTRAFLDQAETLCDGNGTRYVISQGKLRSMIVQVPPIPEQTAIARVLTEMDVELAALEQRREKTHALKQAMMQELLTGRTRLV